MKKIRRLAGVLLALVMVMGLGVTAMADGPYTITINNTTSGHTYEAYQIFDGDLSGSGTATDPYVLSNIVWGSGVDTTSAVEGKTLLEALQALTVNGSQPFSACTTAAAVAEVLGSDDNKGTDSAVAQAFADIVGLYLASSPSATSSENKDVDNKTTNYTISITDPGYYLVKDQDSPISSTSDDSYTRFILEVVANVSATPKSSTPTVEKKVYEDSYSTTDGGYGYGYNDVADYDIGDAVQFKLIGTLPNTLGDYETYKYVFHDTLSSGLTFNSNSVEVTVDGTVVPVSYGSTTNYEIKYTSGSPQSDGCTFEVVFEDILSLVDSNGAAVTVSSSSEIVVTYTATLNGNAEIGLDGNTNTVKLEYSNNPNPGGSSDTGTTPVDKVIVFTYELDVTKVDEKDNTKKLKGATFVLYKEGGQYAQVDTSTGKVTGWTDTEADATTLTSDDAGFFKIVGLDDGTYYLKETAAPTGYNKLSSEITLVIDATTINSQNWSGTASEALTGLEITVDTTKADGNTGTGIVSATVKNNAGATLPSAGGIGTTIFYIVGGLLVCGAAVLLIVRRGMSRRR